MFYSCPDAFAWLYGYLDVLFIVVGVVIHVKSIIVYCSHLCYGVKRKKPDSPLDYIVQNIIDLFLVHTKTDIFL